MISIKESYRSAVIYMMLRMMAADGHREKAEYIYILRVAAEMGMTMEDIAALTPEDLIIHDLPADEKERMIILYYLLFMMDTDGDISPDEINLVQDLGYHLGFRIEMVSDLIHVIKNYDNTAEMPSDALLDKIRTYLN